MTESIKSHHATDHTWEVYSETREWIQRLPLSGGGGTKEEVGEETKKLGRLAGEIAHEQKEDIRH